MKFNFFIILKRGCAALADTLKDMVKMKYSCINISLFKRRLEIQLLMFMLSELDSDYLKKISLMQSVEYLKIFLKIRLLFFNANH